ncbi:MAG: hypothetical protein ACSHX9_15790 [Luteolibacter sp.]
MISKLGTRFSSLACCAIALGGLFTEKARGIEIEIDYSLDTEGFFDQAGAKEALRAVCDYYEVILTDELEKIDVNDWPAGNSWFARFFHPATGVETFVDDLLVPEDTIIIFAAGNSSLGSAGLGGVGGFGFNSATVQEFIDVVATRGVPGVLSDPATDIASWGGTVSFDSSREWEFLLDGTGEGSVSDFVSIALHEVCHVLGVATEYSSFTRYVVDGNFTGPNSVASFGGLVPLDSTSFHWQNDGVCVVPTGHSPTNPLNVLSKTVAQFGVPAGVDQIALMDPEACRTGNYLKVLTALDVAGLADVGWEVVDVRKQPPLTIAVDPVTGNVTVSWIAISEDSYQVQEAEALGAWGDIGDAISGVTGSASYVDTDPPVGKNFYRLAVNQPAAEAAAQVAEQSVVSSSRGSLVFASRSPAMATGCVTCGGHD